MHIQAKISIFIVALATFAYAGDTTDQQDQLLGKRGFLLGDQPLILADQAVPRANSQSQLLIAEQQAEPPALAAQAFAAQPQQPTIIFADPPAQAQVAAAPQIILSGTAQAMPLHATDSTQIVVEAPPVAPAAAVVPVAAPPAVVVSLPAVSALAAQAPAAVMASPPIAAVVTTAPPSAAAAAAAAAVPASPAAPASPASPAAAAAAAAPAIAAAPAAPVAAAPVAAAAPAVPLTAPAAAPAAVAPATPAVAPVLAPAADLAAASAAAAAAAAPAQAQAPVTPLAPIAPAVPVPAAAPAPVLAPAPFAASAPAAAAAAAPIGLAPQVPGPPPAAAPLVITPPTAAVAPDVLSPVVPAPQAPQIIQGGAYPLQQLLQDGPLSAQLSPPILPQFLTNGNSQALAHDSFANQGVSPAVLAPVAPPIPTAIILNPNGLTPQAISTINQAISNGLVHDTPAESSSAAPASVSIVAATIASNADALATTAAVDADAAAAANTDIPNPAADGTVSDDAAVAVAAAAVSNDSQLSADQVATPAAAVPAAKKTAKASKVAKPSKGTGLKRPASTRVTGAGACTSVVDSEPAAAAAVAADAAAMPDADADATVISAVVATSEASDSDAAAADSAVDADAVAAAPDAAAAAAAAADSTDSTASRGTCGVIAGKRAGSVAGESADADDIPAVPVVNGKSIGKGVVVGDSAGTHGVVYPLHNGSTSVKDDLAREAAESQLAEVKHYRNSLTYHQPEADPSADNVVAAGVVAAEPAANAVLGSRPRVSYNEDIRDEADRVRIEASAEAREAVIQEIRAQASVEAAAQVSSELSISDYPRVQDTLISPKRYGAASELRSEARDSLPHTAIGDEEHTFVSHSLDGVSEVDSRTHAHTVTDMTESERMGAGEQAAESAMDNEERISALMATQGVRSYTVVNDTPAGEMKVHYDGDSATMYAAAGEGRAHEGMETFVEATPTQYYEHQKERLTGEGGSREAPNHFVNMHGDSAYEYEHEQSYPEHEQSYPGHEQSYPGHEQSYPEHEQLYSDREHEQACSEGENGHSAVDSGHHDAPNNFVNVHGDAAFAHDAALALPSHITSNSPMFSATAAAAGNEPRAVNELDPLSYGSEIYTHRKDLPLVAPADKPVSAHPVVMTMPQSPFAPTLAEDMHPVIRFVMSTISAATAPPSSQGPSFPPGPWPPVPAPAGPASQGSAPQGPPPPSPQSPMPQGPMPQGPMPQGPLPPMPNVAPSQSVMMVTKLVTPSVKFVTEVDE